MNERIKELAEQAEMSVKWGDPNNYDDYHRAMDEWEEKFAELIVRECIGILSRNNPCPPGSTIMYSLIQDEYFDEGWQVAVETKANQIKKHFGVSE